MAPAAWKHDGQADCYYKENMELGCFLYAATPGVYVEKAAYEMELPQDYFHFSYLSCFSLSQNCKFSPTSRKKAYKPFSY